LRPGSDPDHPVPSAAGVLPAPVSPPFPTITPHGRRSSYHPHPGRRTDALGSKKRADGSKEGGTAGPLTLLYTRQAPLGLRKRTQRAGPFRRGVIEPVRLVIWSMYPAAPDLNPAVNPTRTSATALRRRPGGGGRCSSFCEKSRARRRNDRRARTRRSGQTAFRSTPSISLTRRPSRCPR
jgi:hypothetical protein